MKVRSLCLFLVLPCCVLCSEEENEEADKDSSIELVRAGLYKKYVRWAIGNDGNLLQTVKGNRVAYIDRIVSGGISLPTDTHLYQVFYLSPSYIEVRNGPKYYVKGFALVNAKLKEIRNLQDIVNLGLGVRNNSSGYALAKVVSRLMGGEILFATSESDLRIFKNRLSMLELSSFTDVFDDSKAEDWRLSITKSTRKTVIEFPHVGLERLKSAIYRIEIVDGKLKSIELDRILFNGVNYL